MSIPVKTVVVALVLGILAAVIVYMRQPAAPAEEQMAEAQQNAAGPVAPATQPAVTLAEGERHTTATGLTIIDVKVGDGVAAKPGDRVFVHYTGRLYYGGKKFDSSYDRGAPFDFALGAKEVIGGWDQGIVGMKVGGKRQLVIPPDLAYGDRGAGNGVIPPGATLQFDVEMMKIAPGQ